MVSDAFGVLGTHQDTDGGVGRESEPRRFREDTMREACHDLRQPVATISALASAALGESGLSSEMAGWLQLILAETRYIDGIVLDVLGAADAACPIDVGALVTAVVRARLLTATCAIEGDVAPVQVLGSRVQLYRAIDNLVDNAERAAGPTGRVRIGVRWTDGQCVVDVEDDGPGFGARVPSRWRLGLQVVSRVTADLDGRLEIGDSAMGGACVRLVLPALGVQERAS